MASTATIEQPAASTVTDGSAQKVDVEQPVASTGTDESAQKVDKRTLVIILGLNFLINVSYGLLFPLMPFMNTKVGGGAYGIGVLTSSYSVSRLAGCLLAGPLSDIVGRRPIILVAVLLSAIAYVGLEMASTFWFLDCARLLQGLVGGANPVMQASLSVMVPRSENAKYQGYFATTSGVAMAVGPGIGGILGNFLGVSGACYVPAAICVLGFVVALILLREPQAFVEKEGRAEGAGHPESEEVTSEQTTKCTVVLQCVPAVLAGGCWWAHMSIFEAEGALYYETVLNMSQFKYGMYWTLIGATMTVCCMLAPSRLVKRLGAREANACVCIVGAVGCTMLAILRTEWMAWIVAVSFSVSFINQPLQAVMLTELSTSNFRGSVIGMSQAFASLGRILGPLAGAVAYKAGPADIFYAAAMFATLAAFAPFAYCPRQAEARNDEPTRTSFESTHKEDVSQSQDSTSEVNV